MEPVFINIEFLTKVIIKVFHIKSKRDSSNVYFNNGFKFLYRKTEHFDFFCLKYEKWPKRSGHSQPDKGKLAFIGC